LNLVCNAHEAIPSGGTITIRTYFNNGIIVLAVQDNGSGIPEEVLSKLGTPFITTKESGTGLGLAVCYRIAERHGAEIVVETSSAGTTVSVKFRSVL
jgi:signal transduction histidine kinase